MIIYPPSTSFLYDLSFWIYLSEIFKFSHGQQNSNKKRACVDNILINFTDIQILFNFQFILQHGQYLNSLLSIGSF